jgi:hypothetical protein
MSDAGEGWAAAAAWRGRSFFVCGEMMMEEKGANAKAGVSV